MITNTQLVNYAKQALGREYWYGCFGQKATQTLLTNKSKQYPQYYNRSNYVKGWTCDGKRVFDCIGLIKAAYWSGGNYNSEPKYSASQDYSANSMLKACKTKGKISTLPEVQGVLVFKTGHVGIYVGNGYVIHAAGHNKGVVKEKLSTVAWTDWGYCPMVSYPTTTATKQAKSQTTATTYTHKVIKPVNIRTSASVLSSKADFDKLPEYVKKQITGNVNYLPAGVKLNITETKNNWLKISDNIWIAGNYATKI